MTQSTLIEQGRQGDTSAIASLVRQWLSPYPITPEVKSKDNCLFIVLKASPIPDEQAVVPPLRERLRGLDPQGYTKIKICGQDTEDGFPEWYQEFELFDSMVVLSKLNEQPKTQKKPESSDSDDWFNQVAGAAGTFFGTASEVGNIMTGTFAGVSEVVNYVANEAGNAFTKTASEVGDAVSENTLKTTKQWGSTLEQIGSSLDWVNHNPISKQVAKVLPFNWLFIVDRIDIPKATAEVEKLQQKYPSEKPNEIAHRLMVNKATFAAGSGFVSSLIPGFAVALFAIDLAATMSLQAELVYQIAHAYGFDLNDSDRKGEALAILSLALGGGQALKVGGGFATKAGLIGFLRNIPIAGALVGTSTNAAMTYALGYAACNFYETQLNSATSEESLAASQAVSDEYRKNAIAQEVVMDQILMHIIVANNPHRSKQEIVRELETLNLSPASLEAIRSNLQSPPSLDALLNQLHSDYALPLLVKCYRIVQTEDEMQPKAAQVIDKITQKFDLDIDSLKEVSY